MRILMTTWEFPPYKLGGIGSHCYDLSKTLVDMGHEVHVLAFGDQEREEIHQGVIVHRVPSTYAPDTISWATFLGHRMEKKAIELHKEHKFDVVHGHDWMMVAASVGIKKTLKLPFVFTLHSTESGRSGVHDTYTKMINDLEWYGTYEAKEIISVGKDFAQEIKNLFHPPDEKIHYIPNGVDLERFDAQKYIVNKFDYMADWERMVLYVGRMSHQKGVEYLIQAIPHVLREHPESKFVFAGGGAVDWYRDMAWKAGLKDKTFFTGYVDERMLPSLLRMADVTVTPSIYEPFGIVVLEAHAAQTPVVGSYTGGLKETIVHEWSGLHSYPAHVSSLVEEINRILSDLDWADWMGRNGRKSVEKNYTWEKIARWTSGIYNRAVE